MGNLKNWFKWKGKGVDWKIFRLQIWLDLKVFKSKETIKWWDDYWKLGTGKPNWNIGERYYTGIY